MPSFRRLVKSSLIEEGFHILEANDWETTISKCDRNWFDTVIIDDTEGFSQISGTELMQRIRETSNTPIVFVGNRNKMLDTIRNGADDFVANPILPEELAVRVAAVIRRSERPHDPEDSIVTVGAIVINLMSRIVTKDGEVVPLTRTEWMLLKYLAENVNRILTNSELLSRVWGGEYHDDNQYLRVWISRLRTKIEPEPEKHHYSIIKTFNGMGYMLSATPEKVENEIPQLTVV